jgi:predicted molibdopterin-dependent oxidoreductase YjgC
MTQHEVSPRPESVQAPQAPQERLRRLRRADRGSVEIAVDGTPVRCFEGETVAVALLAERGVIGRDAVRAHGLWCGIGMCYECVVTVDGVPGVRACLTPVRPGMQVDTAIGRGGSGRP